MIPSTYPHGTSQPTSPIQATSGSPIMYDGANAASFAGGFPIDQSAYGAPSSAFTYPYGYQQPSYGANPNAWNGARYAAQPNAAAPYASFSSAYPNQAYGYSTGMPGFPVPPQQQPGGSEAMHMNGGGFSSNGNGGMSIPGEQQPSYVGYVKTTADAILLLSACDLPSSASALSPASGLRTRATPPPRRVTRRLLDSERLSLIRSGSAFCWDEKEAGMKRWTDGRCWSASRVSGCFLTYRELEARKKPAHSGAGNGPTQNQYKIDGLIKQSFSMTTTSGRKLHIINYYTKRDIREGRLRRVSEDPRFVGEGGGEWGLHVDEAEYPDPAARLEENEGREESAASGSVASPRSIPSQPSDHQYFGSSAQPGTAPDSPPTTAPHSASGAIHSFGERAQYGSFSGSGAPLVVAAPKRSGLAGGAVSPAPRFVANFPASAMTKPRLGKRLLRDEDDMNGDHLRVPLKSHYLHDSSHERVQRPRLSRPRGSSPSSSNAAMRLHSDGYSSSDTRSGGSFQGSATSIATTVESNSRDSGDEKDKTATNATHGGSLLGLSSLMASAPKMALSRSEQESAVGALLSLRGEGPSAASTSSPPHASAEQREKSPSSPKGASLPSLASLPSRTTSDRQALNMFSIRL